MRELLVLILGVALLFGCAAQETPTPPANPPAVVPNGTGDTPPLPPADEPPVMQNNSTVSPPNVPAGLVTRAELATHNTEGNCWVGYKEKVYDVTAWLPKHPGTAAAIAPYCGTVEEFTAAFTGKHGTFKEGTLEQEGVLKGDLAN